jgi:hypothetical protein
LHQLASDPAAREKCAAAAATFAGESGGADAAAARWHDWLEQHAG